MAMETTGSFKTQRREAFGWSTEFTHGDDLRPDWRGLRAFPRWTLTEVMGNPRRDSEKEKTRSIGRVGVKTNC